MQKLLRDRDTAHVVLSGFPSPFPEVRSIMGPCVVFTFFFNKLQTTRDIMRVL